MITKDYLKAQMIRIESSYGRDRFKITKEMFSVWYGLLAGYEPQGIKAAVDECLLTSQYPPSIADVNIAYQKIMEHRKHLGTLINAKYKMVLNWFEEEYDSETRKMFIDYVWSFPNDEREIVITDVAYDAITWWNNCNAQGLIPSEKITFKHFLEGLSKK